VLTDGSTAPTMAAHPYTPCSTTAVPSQHRRVHMQHHRTLLVAPPDSFVCRNTSARHVATPRFIRSITAHPLKHRLPSLAAAPNLACRHRQRSRIRFGKGGAAGHHHGGSPGW
jgi:hypothetical protein